MDNTTNPDIINTEELISLMSVYREEWKYRDEAFMSHFFMFFTISFFITFFPNLSSLVGFDGYSVLFIKMPPLLFPILGIACAVIGLYYSICESSRIVNIDKAYFRLIEMLPSEDLKVKRIQDDTSQKAIVRNLLSLRLNKLLYLLYLFPAFVAVLDIIALVGQ